MQIRLATIADSRRISDFIMPIARAQIGPTLSEAGLSELLAGMTQENQVERIQSGFPFFLGYLDEKILGIAAVRPPCHLYYLFVDPTRQRQGIGRQLWTHVRRSINPTPSQHSITVNSSLNAISAYLEFGFALDGPVQDIHGIRFQPMRANLATDC